MKDFWVIPLNGKWIHVKASKYTYSQFMITFYDNDKEIAVFVVANTTGIIEQKNSPVPNKKLLFGGHKVNEI